MTWKNFCLEQINSADSPDCKVWEQPDPTQRRSLIAAMSGEAAKKQGSDHFEKFHLALLTARHGGDGRIALNEIKPMLDLAEEVGLDTTKFKQDIIYCRKYKQIQYIPPHIQTIQYKPHIHRKYNIIQYLPQIQVNAIYSKKNRIHKIQYKTANTSKYNYATTYCSNRN